MPALQYAGYTFISWVDSGYYDGLVVRVIKGNQVMFESYHGGFADMASLHVASAEKCSY